MVNVIIMVKDPNGGLLLREVDLPRVPVAGDFITMQVSTAERTWNEACKIERVVLEHSSKATAVVNSSCPVTVFDTVSWTDPDVRRI